MAHVPQKQMSLVKVTKEIVRAHTSFLQFSRGSGSLIESLVGMPEFWTAEYVYYMVLTAHQSRFQGEKLVLLHLIIRP